MHDPIVIELMVRMKYDAENWSSENEDEFYACYGGRANMLSRISRAAQASARRVQNGFRRWILQRKEASATHSAPPDPHLCFSGTKPRHSS